MNAKDQLKVLREGFTIVRARDFVKSDGIGTRTHEIFAKTKERSEWHSFEWQFKSKAERDRKIKELCKLNLIIED